MNQARVLTLVSVTAFVLCSSGQVKTVAQPNPKVKLWAAIGIARPPLCPLNEANTIQVLFAVVNDGQTTVNPGTDSSHLYINGAEPIDWSFVLHNGPRASNYNSLAPGEFLQFSYQLGDKYFAKPGIYSLRWEGQGFKAPEITFRVTP